MIEIVSPHRNLLLLSRGSETVARFIRFVRATWILSCIGEHDLSRHFPDETTRGQMLHVTGRLNWVSWLFRTDATPDLRNTREGGDVFSLIIVKDSMNYFNT